MNKHLDNILIISTIMKTMKINMTQLVNILINH